MSKILIFGPLGDHGGRELETGFIAHALSKDFEVEILSSGNLTFKSQLFDFVPFEKVFTLNQLIYNKSFWFRLLSVLSSIRSKKKLDKYAFVSNSVAKSSGYRKFALSQIHSEIDKCDLVLLCAQITSNYVGEIVDYAKRNSIPVVFRPSTTIHEENLIHRDWLNDINLYLHHSTSNANKLNSLNQHRFEIIDQCAYNEAKLLKLDVTNKAENLLYAGRISEEKGILDFTQEFMKLKTNLRLRVVGDGPQMNKLESVAESFSKIHVLGFLDQDNLVKEIEKSDIVVIPSFEESGPLIGLEAMASGRIILSTKVGAMPERLENLKNQFWFRVGDMESLKSNLVKIQCLKAEEIEKIAYQNRECYLQKYTVEQIKSQYKNAIFKALKSYELQ
ncbi:glycosyltransferase family 4 protein [Winogradskyella alexanderae]|uniref:Glycosyltransferase family 4 protein n=1 Tax=Winogradskyella alexanderae TaxID=2877123 RepID=A0ABS7XPP1_9FLAO|nr:glycosyltransferase family 4 protein [Winogradskyella alexanderae]MCA0131975.1 glycosyltransferase family 4 protein [Winogradskyella alexanderae]